MNSSKTTLKDIDKIESKPDLTKLDFLSQASL